MSSEVTVWNKVMGAALSMPGVKVDRDEFLKKELKIYCSPEQLEQAISSRPINGVSKDVIDRIASACINSHTAKVTAVSAIAGIPGGLAMAGTIPADMAQYYWHVFVLAQKLAYLYGFPDLRDEKGNLTDTASDMLTLFVGVMMGASAANQAIKGLAKEFAKQVVKRLPQKTLTKTVYYPIIKQVAKWIGVRLTRDTFAKGVGKAIPVLGGVISGGLTFGTFRPSAKRLQHKLQEEMFLINDNYQDSNDSCDSDQYTPFEDIDNDSKMDENQTINKDELILMVLINFAKIDHNFTEKKRDFIDCEIEKSPLSEDEQLHLASSYNIDQTFQVDFNIIKGDDLYSVSLMKKLICLSKLEGKISLAEKIYLRKIARELGYSSDDLNDFINEQ